jgi:hypothetical protein
LIHGEHTPQYEENESQVPSLERRDQFRCLIAEDAPFYWRLLEWLAARRRLGELEVDVEELRQGVPTTRDLGGVLRQLESWGNLTTRIEPRKIRTLEDRRVERFRILLGEETAEILEFVAQQVEAPQVDAELAEDRLRILEAALAKLRDLLRTEQFENRASMEAAAFCLRQLRREATQADKDLFQFAQAVRLQARMSRPSGEEVALLVERLKRYMTRYLDAFAEVRHQCEEHLRVLQNPDFLPARTALEAHILAVMEDSSLLTGRLRRPVVVVNETLAILQRFFSVGGELERRCEEIHRATLQMVHSLKRHLEELVTRSQRRALLRSATDQLLSNSHGTESIIVDRFFDELWLVVRPHSLEGSSTPSDRCEVELPGPASRRKHRENLSYIQTVQRPRGVVRSLAEREMAELNEFVQRSILRGTASQSIEVGSYNNPDDLRLLFRALRAGRDHRNPMVKRLLKFRVEIAPSIGDTEVLVPILGRRLTSPRLRFVWENHDGR